MSKNLRESLLNQIFLMSYDPKKTFTENKTLTENIDAVKNKKIIFEQNPRLDDYYGSEEYQKYLEKKSSDREIKKASEYPSFCKYKEHAALPSKNKTGAEGVDAIPPNYCFYSTIGGGIFLDQYSLSSINIFTLESVDRLAQVIVDEGKDHGLTKEAIMNNLAKTLGLGKISSFTVSGITFSATVRSTNKGPWFFGYFSSKDKKIIYKNPEMVDMRGSWDYFVDEWGDAVQIGLAIITAFIPVGGLAFAIEIATELAIGVITAQRSYEKGENVAAAFNILFGMLPMLKFSKYFRGVSKESFKNLAKQFGESGLSDASTVSDYIRFYNNLDNEGKTIMNQMFKHDEITKNEMFKELAQKLTDEKIAKEIKDNYESLFEEIGGFAPGQMIKHNLPTFKKLFARELTTIGSLMLLQTAVEVTLGEKLNSQQEETFKWVYMSLGENTPSSEQMLMNFIDQADKSGVLLDDIKNDSTYIAIKEALPNPKDVAENAKVVMDSVLTSNFNNNNVNYYDLEGQVVKSDTIEVVNNASTEKLKGYSNLGWKLAKEVPVPDWPDETNRYKTINDNLYILTYE
jgi:hypothetical protein